MRNQTKNLLLLWQGVVVTQASLQTALIGLIFWTKQLTESVSSVSILVISATLPVALVGMIGGAAADMTHRRSLIVFGGVATGFLLFASGLLLSYTDSPTSRDWVLVCAIASLAGTINAFTYPAVMASMPEIVTGTNLRAANSFIESSREFTVFVGQGMGAFIFQWVGVPLLLIGAGIVQITSGFAQLMLRLPVPIRKPVGGDSSKVSVHSRLIQFLDGLRWITRDRSLRMVFYAIASMNVFAVPVIVLLPFYVSDVLLVSPTWFGYLTTGFAGGMFFGFALTNASLAPIRIPVLPVTTALIVFGMAIMSLGTIRTPAMALVAMTVAGAMSGYINVNTITALQRRVSKDYLGRVFGVVNVVSTGFVPVSMILVLLVIRVLNNDIAMAYTIFGLVLVILCVWIASNPDFRKLYMYSARGESNEVFHEG